jgi:hypothetical protein
MYESLFHSRTRTGNVADQTDSGQYLPAGQSFLGGCGEKRVSQPVGLSLAGSPNSCRHVARFIGAQADRKKRSEGVLLCQSRPSHFFRHTTKKRFIFKKCLTTYYFSCTKSLVLNYETKFCRKSARTSSARLASQRHPAVTGAGKERLAMKADTIQAGTLERQSRSLKVEATGDFWRGKIKPRIRIAGKWLEKAGFKPGHRVQILVEQPGSLTLRFLDQSKEVAR